MELLASHVAPPHECGYLPDREATFRYDYVKEMTSAEYGERLRQGWRRFGISLFQPQCENCRACQSIRVEVAKFQPDRSQKRAWAANAGEVILRIGEPQVTDEKLALYDKFHEFQHFAKEWPYGGPKEADDYAESFVWNPIATEEWCYTLGDRLVGVGYVDSVPDGLSAIYFFYDPDERARSLGTFNVMNIIASAAKRRLPYVYLGYYVKGCGSLEYKANYGPNEAFDWESGTWKRFIE